MLRTPLVNVMTSAAQKAARGLARDFGEVEHLQVSKKGPSDFVSTADKKAEKVLFEELQRARPKYGFLMEEQGEIEGSDTSNRWIIDPLDGTTNFLHGIQQFAISIALERDGQIFAGVIYNPITDEMFAAEKGQGAFLNGRRLRVSARRDLGQSLFSTGIPFQGRDNHELFLAQLKSIMAVSAGVRRFGAASLDLAGVAAGRYEGFWEQNLQPWDMAAGIILVTEAGGFVSDLAGGREIFARGDIAAGNDAMHTVLLKTLREGTAGLS